MPQNSLVHAACPAIVQESLCQWVSHAIAESPQWGRAPAARYWLARDSHIIERAAQVVQPQIRIGRNDLLAAAL